MTETNLGRLVRGADGRQHELHFTRSLPHAPAKVWRALTEPEHLAAWFPCEIRGERHAGAPLQFVFEGAEDEAIAGQLVVFEPHRALEYRWGDERLRFDLDDDGEGGTVLTFVNGFDTYGKAARDGAGWHVCLDALAARLAGEPPPADHRRRWEEVEGRYLAAFGAEAGTVKPPDGR